MTTELPEFDTAEWRAIRDRKMLEWVGDREAIEFITVLFDAAELFDDVIDGDRAIETDHVIRVLLGLTTELPLNGFFDKYKLSLIPLIVAGVNAWLDANVLERGSDNDKAMAYVLRDWYMELLSFVVYLVRGQKHLREVSLDMRKFFSQHETLDEYKRKLQ